jgi:hypothetical protein
MTREGQYDRYRLKGRPNRRRSMAVTETAGAIHQPSPWSVITIPEPIGWHVASRDAVVPQTCQIGGPDRRASRARVRSLTVTPSLVTSMRG